MFITVEGVDGSGKSLQSRLLADALKSRGHNVLLTREPGGTEGAEALRNLVLNGEEDRWSAMSETLIFTAARRDHCERVIWPAMERGDVVICDRFADSTRLYQGLVSDELAKAVDAIHDIAIHTSPDLTFIFDIEPKKAFLRMSDRSGLDMRFEGHGIEFQETRRAGFLDIAQNEPERCVVINADQPVEAITQDCLDILIPRLEHGK